MGDTTRIGTACSSADKQNVHESNCSPSQPKMHASIKLISLLLSITFPASALGTFEPSQKSVHQVVVPSESPLHRVEKPTENVPIHMVTQKLPSLEYSTYGGNEPHYRRLAANEALVCWAETHLKVNSTMSLYLGVFLTVAGTLFMTAGNILMKLGSEMEGKTQSTWLGKDIQWIYGMLAYSAGAFLHVVALGLAPASVLSPMNSLGLIANAIASTKILKEPFGLQETLFTGGCAVGVFLCACASVLPRTDFNVKTDLEGTTLALGSWADPWYLAYLGVCIVLGFAAFVYINTVEEAPHGEIQLDSFSETVPTPESTSASRGLNRRQQQYRQPRLAGLVYGLLAGLTGSQCVLELKEIGASFVVGLKDPSVWIDPQIYFILAFLSLSIWLQIYFLNLGLEHGDATTVVPTYYVIWTFFGIIGGFAKYHEIKGFSMAALILFGLGFALTALCIILLAFQEIKTLRIYADQQVPEPDEEDADLAVQDVIQQRLEKRVTFAMGLFPFSSLGRSTGRQRFRSGPQRMRRTRSTASDSAVDGSYRELTLGSIGGLCAFTIPPSMHLARQNCDAQQRVSETENVLQDQENEYIHAFNSITLDPRASKSRKDLPNQVGQGSTGAGRRTAAATPRVTVSYHPTTENKVAPHPVSSARIHIGGTR